MQAAHYIECITSGLFKGVNFIMIDLMNMSADWIATLIFVGCFVFLGLTALFRWLWNTTLPELFEWPTVTFVQAFKLMLMSAILFGAVGNLFSYSATNTTTVTSNDTNEHTSVTQTNSKTMGVGVP
jgi:drug/metabolite transporter (DMT)-like permease